MQRDFSQIKNRHFDVLICGGGIYGAWTAYDAALRGLKVAIVDQGDWACGTSSASSKLIHGGLRATWKRWILNWCAKLLLNARCRLKQHLTGSGRYESGFRFIKIAVLARSDSASV